MVYRETLPDGTTRLTGAGGSGGTPGEHSHTVADLPASLATESEATSIANTAVSTHAAAADPHPNYLTAAEGNVAYAPNGHTHTGLAPAPHAATHQPGGSDAMVVNAAIGVGSLRSLGKAPLEAAAGDHLHDERYAPIVHDHDSRYYTETEVDTKLAGKSNTGHSHVLGDLPTTLATDAEVATAVSNHEAAADPHPVYTTTAEATGISNTAVANHAAAADPHPVYAKDTDLGAYIVAAQKDEVTIVPHVQRLDFSGAGVTVVAEGPPDVDQVHITIPGAAAAIAAHEAAADPHPVYLTKPEGDGLYSPTSHLHDNRYYTEAESDAALALKANDSAVVHKTGDETIAGVKLFTDPLHFEEETASPPIPTSGARFFTRAGRMWVRTPTSEYALETVSQNLGFIANGDFEAVKSSPSAGHYEPMNWNGFWHTGDAWIATETGVGNYQTGVRSCRSHISAVNGDNVVNQSDVFGVIGGGVLLLDFNAKGEVGAQILVEMQSSIDSTNNAPDFFATGTVVTGSETVVFSGTGWNHYSRAIKVPAGHTLARVTFRTGHAGADAVAHEVFMDTVVGRMQNDAVSGAFGNLPVGSVIPFSADVIPTGYLLCDGRSVPRASYPALFALIGESYGKGDDATQFKVPDMRGQVALGLDATDGNMNTLARRGGEKTHVLTNAEMPQHGHDYQYSSSIQALWGYYNTYAVNGNWVASSGWNPQNATGTTTLSGGNVGHNNMQPYMTLHYIIRALPSAGTDMATFHFFKGYVPAATSVAFAANTNMAFGNRIDAANAWNAASNYWVVPVNGKFRITAACRTDSAVGRRNLMIFKNGAQFAISPDSVYDSYAGAHISDVLDLVAGDTIAVRASSAFNTNADTGENTYMTIESVGLAAAPVQASPFTAANAVVINQCAWGNAVPTATQGTAVTTAGGLLVGTAGINAYCTASQTLQVDLYIDGGLVGSMVLDPTVNTAVYLSLGSLAFSKMLTPGVHYFYMRPTSGTAPNRGTVSGIILPM